MPPTPYTNPEEFFTNRFPSSTANAYHNYTLPDFHTMTSLTLRTMRTSLCTSMPRAFSTSRPTFKIMGNNPDSNLPDPSKNSSAAPNAKVRSDTQNTDKQSSASPDEHKSGDDHPAKQPDHQQQPSRTTGIGGETQVQGGKEGLGERGDRH
ncbi:hypothetical protein BDW02DRAFT_563893 [Decorospora gaudefroyi]|uniref:Uncharacterized protein n=1 Tax=Decorospora gaudefroyi TaxID=184978 RepID=A0A6A5KWK3_9PLEO|nr:hypothetical protein BDW02DRAFT_563893 [Decorospora gaudefroyi]